MKNKPLLAWGVAAALVLLCSALSSFATTKIYLSIPNIPGEVTDSGYSNQIQVLTFSEGITNTASVSPAGGGFTAGTAGFTDIVVSKYIDRASPMLYVNCGQGTQFAGPLVMTVVSENNGVTQLIYTIKMSYVFITGVHSGTADASGDIQETLNLACGKIEWDYQPYDQSGAAGSSVIGVWNQINHSAN